MKSHAEQTTKHSRASLCNRCTLAIGRARTKPGRWDGRLPSRFSYPARKDSWQGSHRTSRNSLVRGLKLGCRVCHHLYSAAPRALRKYAEYFQSYYELRKGSQAEWELKFTLEISAEVNNVGGAPRVIECPGTFQLIPRASLDTTAESPASALHTMEGGVPVQMKAWLQHCSAGDEGHMICQSFPTAIDRSVNLLHVDPQHGEKLLLEEFPGSSQLPKYATVSYLRDIEQHGQAWMPLTGTYKSSRTSITLPILPDALQTAVHLARNLGINYIWLECLSPPQSGVDSPNQSVDLVGQMYSGSTCHIAFISHLEDTDHFATETKREGLLQPLLISAPDQSSAELTHMVEYDDLWCSALLDSGVHYQASSLQGRLLSPRTVYIGGAQTFWECRAHKACEAHPQGIPAQFLNNKAHAWNPTSQIVPEIQRLQMHDPKQSKLGVEPATSTLPPLSTSARKVFYEYWSNVVRLYMLGDHAVPSHKLRGIQGLVSMLQRFIRENYLFGLWENDRLAEGLLWFVIRRQQCDGSASSRPETYRAPSWSWASIDAQIRWNWHLPCRKILIDVERADVEYAGSNGGGEITSAEMRIRGHLIPVRIEAIRSREDGSPLEDGSYALLPKGTLLNPFNMDRLFPRPNQEPVVYLDEALEFRPARDAYILPVCIGWPDHTGSVVSEVAGLILQRQLKDDRVVYERLGVYALSKPAVAFMSTIFAEHKDTLSRVTDTCHSDSIVLV